MKKIILSVFAVMSFAALAPAADARPYHPRFDGRHDQRVSYDRYGRPIIVRNVFVGRDRFGRPIYERQVVRQDRGPRYACPPPRGRGASFQISSRW